MNEIEKFKKNRMIPKALNGQRFKKVGRSTMGYTIWADTQTGHFYTGDWEDAYGQDPNKDFGTNKWKNWKDEGTQMSAWHGLLGGHRINFNGSDYVRKKPVTVNKSTVVSKPAATNSSSTTTTVKTGGTDKPAARSRVTPKGQTYWDSQYQDFLNKMTDDLKAWLALRGIDYNTAESMQGYLLRLGKDLGKSGVDNKWGNASQRAWEDLVNKEMKTPIQPYTPTVPEPEPVVDAPNPFGYKTTNTYEGDDFADRLKGMGIRSNADLINFMHNSGKADWKGDAWQTQFRSDVDRALGGDYSDANIRKTFNTKNSWGGGFLGGGDYADFQNALQTNAGVWNGMYDGKEEAVRREESARKAVNNIFSKYVTVPLLSKPEDKFTTNKFNLNNGFNTLGNIGITLGRFKEGGNINFLKKGGINNTAEGKKVQKFQQLLIRAGYNIKADGYWGKKTQAAYEDALRKGFNNLNGKLIKTLPEIIVKPLQASVLGIPSTKSKKVKSTYTPWKPEVSAGGTVNTKECAEWANDSLRKYKDSKNRILYTYNDIGGDAWTRLSAGKNSKMLYSGYGNEEYDPKVYSEKLSNQRNWAAADKFLKEFDSKTLDKNKTYMVNMYYNSSPNKRKAWEGAKNGTTGTHTGNVYWNDETNSWRVAHNIHGRLHDDDFIQTLGSRNKFGYGITAIAEAPRVDYTRRDWEEEHPIKAKINKIHDFGMWKNGGIIKAQNGIILPGVTVTAINPNRFRKGSEARNFVKALNSNRNNMMKRYGLKDLDYADLSKFAVNIGLRESGLGDGTSYTLRKYIPDGIIHLGKKLVRGRDGSLSRGITQIKYLSDIKDPDLKKEYDDLGITDQNLSKDPNKMAQATIARAVINRRNLNSKKGIDNYHYSNGEIIPQDVALAMYWNRGKLTDYANPHPDNLDVGGATGYARRFLNQKVL